MVNPSASTANIYREFSALYHLLAFTIPKKQKSFPIYTAPLTQFTLVNATYLWYITL